jgi:Tol biopolymer transport system component
MKLRAGLLVLVAVAALVSGWWFGRRDAALPAAISMIRESDLGTTLAAAGCLGLSPDGSRLAFVTTVDGRRMLAVAAADGASPAGPASIVAGSEDARHPSWSADGRRIAFATYERGPLKIVDVASQRISSGANAGSGGSAWNTRGDLLFTAADNALHRTGADGRTSRITTLDPATNEVEHAWPSFLPDGRRFLYLARASRPSDSRLYLSSLDAPHERHVVAEAHSAPLYADGHLLFVYEGILMAQPLDAGTGRVTGVALPLAVGLHWDEWSGEGAFTAANDGLLAFRLARTPPDELAWFTVGAMHAERVAGLRDVHEARRSPDGTRIAATLRDDATGMDDIWIVSSDGGSPVRLTSHPASDNSPVWSPDGSSVVFRSNRSGLHNLYRIDVPTRGAERLLLDSTADDQPTDISAAGLLLFNRWSIDTRQDIWALPLSGGKPFAVLATEFLEGNAAFSPDGAWIAYESNESGATQVHVRRYPADGSGIRISVDGGSKPRWTADGRTVVYVRDDHRFEAVPLEMTSATVVASRPRELFITRPRIDGPGGFDIDPTGSRILAPTAGRTGTPEPAITFIKHWRRLLSSVSSG